MDFFSTWGRVGTCNYSIKHVPGWGTAQGPLQNQEAASKFRRDQQVSGFQVCSAWTYPAADRAAGFSFPFPSPLLILIFPSLSHCRLAANSGPLHHNKAPSNRQACSLDIDGKEF